MTEKLKQIMFQIEMAVAVCICFFDLGSLLEKRHWVYQVLLRNSAPTRIMWKLDHTNSAKINSKII